MKKFKLVIVKLTWKQYLQKVDQKDEKIDTVEEHEQQTKIDACFDNSAIELRLESKLN